MVFVYVFIYQYLILPLSSSLSPSLSPQIQHFWAYLYCVHSFLVLIFGYVFLVLYFWFLIFIHFWSCIFGHSFFGIVFLFNLSLSLSLPLLFRPRCFRQPCMGSQTARFFRQPAFSDSPLFPTAAPCSGISESLNDEICCHETTCCGKETPVPRRLLWKKETPVKKNIPGQS